MPNLHCEAITFPSSDGKHTSSAFLYTVPGPACAGCPSAQPRHVRICAPL